MSIPEPAVPGRPKRNPFAGAAPETAPPADRTPVAESQTRTPKRAVRQDMNADVRKPSKRPTKVPTADILLSMPEDDKQRMINTIGWTVPHTGIKHQQVFIREAIRRYCAALEQQFNAGERFDDIP